VPKVNFSKIFKKAKDILNKDNTMMQFKLETVQGFYNMKDWNSWLKFNAMNGKQLKQAEKVDRQINSILEKLYVPEYQSENI